MYLKLFSTVISNFESENKLYYHVTGQHETCSFNIDLKWPFARNSWNNRGETLNV